MSSSTMRTTITWNGCSNGGVFVALITVLLLGLYMVQWGKVRTKEAWSRFRFLQVGAGIGILLLLLHEFVDYNLGGAQGSEGAKAPSGVRRPRRRRRAECLIGVRRVSASGDEMPGPATRRQVIAGFLVLRGVRAGMGAGRTRAAEGNGRRPIVCTRNRTGPISG